MSLAWTVLIDFAGTGEGVAETDISGYVKSIDIGLGINDLFARTADVGGANLVLDNEDRRFSRAYTSGPYYSSKWLNRCIRISVTDGVTTWTVFRGFTRDWNAAPGRWSSNEATLICVDYMGVLQQNIVSLPLQENLSSDTLIKKIVSTAYAKMPNTVGGASTIAVASGRFDFTGNVTDGDILTINGTAYTFKTTLTPTANQILIGANEQLTIDNLVAGTNSENGSATTYAAGTTRPASCVVKPTNTTYRRVMDSRPVRYYRLGELSGTSAADTGSNNSPGTYNNCTLGTTGLLANDPNTAVTFNGTTSYVEVPSIEMANGSFSLEAWIKPTNAGKPAQQAVWSLFTANSLHQELDLIVFDTGALSAALVGDFTTTDTGVITFDAVNHIVVNYNYADDNMAVYVNGVLEASGGAGPFEGLAPIIGIGISNRAFIPFLGIIDEAALYLRCLTADEVTAHYAARTGAVGVTVEANAYGAWGNALTLAESSFTHFADTVTLTAGTLVTGAVGTTHTQDGAYYQVGEVAATPGFDVRFAFTNVIGAMQTVYFYGRYQGSAGHTVQFEAWDGSGWDVIDTVAHSTTDGADTYTLAAEHTIAGVCTVRFYHTSPGNATHNLYVDYLRGTDSAAAPVEHITPTGATLSGGVDGPVNHMAYDSGAATFDVAGDSWQGINALSAVQQVTDSEIGMFWAARDGDLTFRARNWDLCVGATASTLTEDSEHNYLDIPFSTSQIYNEVIVDYTPRTTVTGGVVAKAQGEVAVPGLAGFLRRNATDTYGSRQLTDLAAQEPYLVTVPFVDPSTGKGSGAKDLILPLVPGTDWTANDRSVNDPLTGTDYTQGDPGGGGQMLNFNVVPKGNGIEMSITNRATGTLYLTDLQVRGTLIVQYDAQTATVDDAASIADYGRNTLSISLPLGNSQILAELLASYLLDRYGQPMTRISSIGFEGETVINTINLYSLEIGDLLTVSDYQNGINTQRYMITGVNYSLTRGGSNAVSSVSFAVRRVDDRQYFILDSGVYGLLDGTNHLAL